MGKHSKKKRSKSKKKQSKSKKMLSQSKKSKIPKMIQYVKLLSIDEIRAAINEFIDDQAKHNTVSSLVLFPSSHGNEGLECCNEDLSLYQDVDIYSSIIDNIKDKHYKDNEAGFNNEKKRLENFINKVKLTTAVGPGTCSLMNVSRGIGADVGYNPNYTTSQLDIAIISRIYNVFIQNFSSIPMTNEIDKFLFDLARRQLRSVFVQSWGNEKKTTITEGALKDLEKGAIWKSINVYPERSDRYYSLKQTDNENPTLDPKYGLHIINATNIEGVYIDRFFEPFNGNLLDESVYFKNNINDDECYSRIIKPPLPPQNLSFTQRLLSTFVKKTSQNITITPNIQSIIDDIRNTKSVRLSDLIFMAFSMNIENLTVFDPSCRPKYLLKVTRRSKIPYPDTNPKDDNIQLSQP